MLRFPSKTYFVLLIQNKFSTCKEEDVFQTENGFQLGKNKLIETR